MQKINTVKGTKDLYGQSLIDHNFIAETFIKICESKNYNHISTPIIENAGVFKKTLGLTSDIISKEMYNFIDQGGDDLVLRPEGTAAIARALVSNSLQDELNKKFFYYGPMFRREKPQSGRLRQFHQVGIELFDEKVFFNDVEAIMIANNFLEKIEIRNNVNLEINSLGNFDSREKYKSELIKFFKTKESSLSVESKKKININPLRILDSKIENDKEIIQKAPKLMDYLDEDSLFFFKAIEKNLKVLGIDYTINPYLVRGLDYYNHTAFEFITSEDKSQNTILAGGRYDGLVSSLGGKNISGIGWAAGVERIVMNIKNFQKKKKVVNFISQSNEFNTKLLEIYNSLQIKENISFNILYTGSFKKKIIKANKLNSYGCFILGEDEFKENKILWKNMESGKQKSVLIDKINDFIKKI
ncbi:MAG: histidine--tRNA ligase [Rickettsiales bacterium]|nr:histidine--tRNA ligase [Rickettsiales bacterium]